MPRGAEGLLENQSQHTEVIDILRLHKIMVQDYTKSWVLASEDSNGCSTGKKYVELKDAFHRNGCGSLFMYFIQGVTISDWISYWASYWVRQGSMSIASSIHPISLERGWLCSQTVPCLFGRANRSFKQLRHYSLKPVLASHQVSQLNQRLGLQLQPGPCRLQFFLLR